MQKKFQLENLGYGVFFESQQQKLYPDESLTPARVIAEHKGAYTAKDAEGEYEAKVTGKQMFTAVSRQEYPAVGDFVMLSKVAPAQAVIHAVLPRKSMLARKYISKNDAQLIATNIDTAFIVESVGRDFNLNRFERYITLARNGGVLPALILNKTDLISKEELEAALERITHRFPTIDVIPTSARESDGLDTLTEYIERGKTYCFLGSSGVGKSTLINALLGKSVITTGDISEHTGRGTHVTTAREMYVLQNGGIVIDNPGMREVGMTADTQTGIDASFESITELGEKCRYADCTHTQEPDCAVLLALESGALDGEMYANYIALKKETEHYEMSAQERREKDRRFGKFIKKALGEFKRHET